MRFLSEEEMGRKRLILQNRNHYSPINIPTNERNKRMTVKYCTRAKW